MFKSKVASSVWRAVVAVVSFGAPLVFASFPSWENLTIGGIVFALLHYAEKKITA